MTASAWNLIKLDATKILHSLTESDIVKRNGNDEVVFKYDLSSKNPISRYIISSEDLAVDNALFFSCVKF